MAAPLDSYYNRFDPAQNFERHMFRAGKVLQSAELNEIQDASAHRVRSIGDAIFMDGDVVRDARVVVDPESGVTKCEAGAIYLDGMVRGVPPGELRVPVEGTILVGIFLQEKVVTEAEDESLLDPAAETRNYNEPGAGRLVVEPAWGYHGDGQDGEFYPVYYVDDGVLRGKEAPPSLGSVSQAIARYDRDSTGSNYVVSGMTVSMLPDNTAGEQVYSVDQGRARVNGFAVDLHTSRRSIYPAEPVIRFIDSEPKLSETLSLQRINVDRPPLRNVTQVRITQQQTSNITRGPAAGTSDALPQQAVVDIVSITQGGTTYVKGTDYRLTGGQVDWSPSGAEPASGSTYSCTFQYISTVTPQDVDARGFSVMGAVPGTLVMTSYNTMLPRIDRLCLNEDGQLLWIEGVSTDFNPVRPPVPNTMLALAQVYQYWDERRYIINDGVRVVPMNVIEAYQDRLDLLTDLVAQNTLVQDINTREMVAKKGLFVDPFIDDSHRDQGLAQNAASFDGGLRMPIAAAPRGFSNDVTKQTTCAYVLEPLLQQTSRTGSMKINPYMSFGIPPSSVTLNPSIDRWTEHQTNWTSAVTREFTRTVIQYERKWHWSKTSESSSTDTRTTTELLSTEQSQIANLRQIDVQFRVDGFGPNEQLLNVTFDGLTVTPEPL